MLYSDAYAYVARALSRSTDTERAAAAKDAIAAAIAEWNLRRKWKYLMMDTRNGITVASCTASSGTVTTPANGFAPINVGQTFTVDDGTPSDTYTITAVASTTSITATGDPAATDFSDESITFSGDIPIVSGTDLYNLPSAFRAPYDARLLTNERYLTWKDQREIDRAYMTQQSLADVPTIYNLFNDASYSASTRPTGRVKVFPTPSINDTLRLRYHRPIAIPSADGDTLDVLDHYIYALLTLAKYYFLIGYNAENVRTGEFKERAEFLFKRAVMDDKTQTGDHDVRMIPFDEWSTGISGADDIL